VKRVSIAMPDWMFDDLAARAHARGVSVTEHIRRAVSLDRLLDEEGNTRLFIERDSRLLEVVRRYPVENRTRTNPSAAVG